MPRFVLSFFLTALAAIQVMAQSTTNPRELTFQVAPATAWTDTGLDLRSGDTVTISVVSPTSPQNSSNQCDPAGSTDSSARTDLPLPGAGPGALIAKLQLDAAPILVGAHTDLHIDKDSHLLLGMNGSGAPSCQNGFQVRVQVSGADSANANAASQPKSRADQLKSQLGNATQVFMSGQFGGKPGANPANATSTNASADAKTSSAPVLQVSNATLDADLRNHLDGLPRRVNDQSNNLGDMVNFVIIGSQKDMQTALEAADWHVADSNNTSAAINAAIRTFEKKDYLAMPMSTLYLFGRKQDYGYEMADPIAMVASRHHFRLWKAPFTWKGEEVWVGAGTHDIGFAKDKRNNGVTHKIDPAVDGERENIGTSLQKSNKAKTFSYYLPPNPVREAKNATGDTYHSDGRLLVVFLQ